MRPWVSYQRLYSGGTHRAPPGEDEQAAEKESPEGRSIVGGFFESDGNSKGGASGDWELLNGFTRILKEPFSGTAPFNYRLRIRGVPGGTHTANVTYTLMSN